MALAELNRSRMQALWNHLPGQPYNWETSAAVLGTTPRQVTELDIAEDWVRAQLRRLIRPFAEARSGVPGGGAELDIIDRTQYRLVQAEDLRADRFPNTYRCEQCGIFTAPRSIGAAPTCPVGHGTMNQFTFVEIHTCGHLSPLRSPRCRNSCGRPMALRNTRALNTGLWQWQCTRCRMDAGGVARWCSCREGRIFVSRATQSSAYYPQQITVLNPPTRSGYGSLSGDLTRPAAIAQVIGALPQGREALMRAISTGGQDPEQTARAALEAIGVTRDNPLWQQMIDQARASTASGGPASTWQADVDALGLSEDHAEVIGDEMLQLALTAGAQPLTIADLTAEAAGTTMAPLYASYQPLMNRYHLSDITLLRELPIAFIVAGFTRQSSTATRASRTGAATAVKFNFFPDQRGGKFNMYGLRSETEGLLFRIDQLEIVGWLVASGVVADPGVTTADQAQKWLLSVMDPVSDIFNAPDNQISKAVLGLIHSMSHRMMKALAARSGLNVDSLAEYLFPSAGAFLIYANTRSQFTLGGIEHVFRYDLADALSELDAETRCMFDPPCRRSFGGACVACLHVSEIACQRFNTVLDRNLLFGSLPTSTLPTSSPAGTATPTAAAAGTSPATTGPVWTAFWTP
jgi:hypothetical protein